MIDMTSMEEHGDSPRRHKGTPVLSVVEGKEFEVDVRYLAH